MGFSRKKENNESPNYIVSNYIINGLTIGLPPLGRLILAGPLENFAKRSQIHPHKIYSGDISKIFFQGGNTITKKLQNMYKGGLISFIYKGTQFWVLDGTFYLRKELEQKLSASVPSENLSRLFSAVLSGGITASIQTPILQPISSIRTRLQVNMQKQEVKCMALVHSETQNNLKKSTLFSRLLNNSSLLKAIQEGNLYKGFCAHWLSSSTYLITSNVAHVGYSKLILTDQEKDSQKANSTALVNITGVLSGSTGAVCAAIFDYVKTKKQVETEKYANISTLKILSNAITTKGVTHVMRAALPNSLGQIVGLIGFYGGKTAVEKIEKRLQVQPAENTGPKI